jgi:hypothetical protein
LTKAAKRYDEEKTTGIKNLNSEVSRGKSREYSVSKRYSKDFLNRTPAAQQLRESMDKCDYIKLKSFHKTKEMVSKLKRLPIEWEKIFASYTSDKGLITRIYREIKKLNYPQINKPIKKWATESNRTFSKEETQMAQKHMKKCSPSLAIKEMQIKTTLRFHLTPVRIAIIKNTTTNKCW